MLKLIPAMAHLRWHTSNRLNADVADVRALRFGPRGAVEKMPPQRAEALRSAGQL